MKLLLQLLVIACFLAPTTLRAQSEIAPPVFGEALSESLSIQKLEITPSETVLHLELVCLDGDELEVPEGEARWYLETDAGKRLTLQSLRDAEYGTVTCGEMPLRYFAMVFEALPDNTQAFTLKEQRTSWFTDVLPQTLETVKKKAESGSLLHEKVLGIYYERQYDYENAEKLYRSYVAQLRKEGQVESEAYISGMNRLIRLQINKGSFETAQQLSEEVLAAVGKEKPAIAKIIFTLGDIYQLLNQHEKAIRSYLDFAALKRKHNNLRRSDLFQLHNMILYSFGSLPEPSPPIAVGAVWLQQPTLDEKSRIQVFAAGASQMMFSEGAAFTEGEWQAYEMYTERLAPKTGERLFVQFKDGQGRTSEVVECMPAEK